MTYTLQANASGSRHLEVTDEHLATIQRFQLLDRLVDSNGIVDEAALDRLRIKARSLLEAGVCKDNSLLHLCLDVLYHANMKTVALTNLIATYHQWLASQEHSQQDERENHDA